MPGEVPIRRRIAGRWRDQAVIDTSGRVEEEIQKSTPRKICTRQMNIMNQRYH
jgi:hypothetical protein